METKKEESAALGRLHAEMERVHLTPTWVYAPKLVPRDPPVTYDHGNETDEPIIWLDALDYPFVNLLQASFFEPFPEPKQPITKPIGFTEERVGLARPTWEILYT
jgi:gentisate 1,2-dioxygenase